MKSAREMTDAELAAEIARMPDVEADRLQSLEESGGCAGSPMESFYERWDEIEAEIKKRAAPLQRSETGEGK